MAAPKQIDFDQIGIAEVLKTSRLIVPPNQREYAWTTKEVTTLFEDLSKAISDEPSGEYFLGMIVTIPRAMDLLEVADGQQRLATTAILLTEMRNYIRGTEPMIARSIEDFLTSIDRDRREEVVKLKLNIDDNEYFRGMVTAKSDAERPQLGNNSSHRRISEAFGEARKHIIKILAGFNKKDHGDILNRWIHFLEHRATVILVTAADDANAYKIFETMNDRGRRTSQADLVKNYILSQAGSDRLIEAQEKWARMRSTLESLDEDDITVTFLRQAMIAIRGHLKENQVFEEVQRKVKGPQSSIQFVAQLEGMSGTYVALFNPAHEKWNKYPDTIRKAIYTLNFLNIRSLRPLMLGVASQFSPKEAGEAFRMFISWGVRLIVASSTSRGAVEERLAGAAHRVFLGEITSADTLRKKLSEILPVDEEFRKAFEIATVSKASLARYYLRSLEMVAKDEPTPWFVPNDDQQVINLEHVLPENPEDNWPNFTEDSAKLYSKKIGNLALLLAKNNSDLRSDGFDKKKVAYRASPYELTRQIGRAKEWGTKQIIDRQKTLADLALKAWPL